VSASVAPVKGFECWLRRAVLYPAELRAHNDEYER